MLSNEPKIKYCLLVTFGQNRPIQQSHDLFTTAKLMVDPAITYIMRQKCTGMWHSRQKKEQFSEEVA